MVTARLLILNHQEDARRELARFGARPEDWGDPMGRLCFLTARVDGMDVATANVLSAGLAHGGGMVLLRVRGDDVDALCCGTAHQYTYALALLAREQPPQAQEVGQAVQALLQNGRSMPAPTAIGPHSFVWGQRTFIMGIINVTPDSFSGDGVGGDVQAAVRQARRFVAAGADILDIGGESTRPGARPVSARTEIRRVVPAIRAIAQALPRTPISVDTWKAEVAQAALAAGAHLVNDVWGLQRDPAMAAVVAQAGCPVVVMHNRTAPPARDEVGGHYRDVAYEDLMADIIAGLRASIARARAAGIPEERIIVDPGLGFGKTAEQNLEVMRRLREVRSLGRPVLVGPSRKSTIGRVLGLPPEKRQEGTAALVTLAIAGGADIVRVHDVRQMVRVVRMTDAVVYGWREQEEAHG